MWDKKTSMEVLTKYANKFGYKNAKKFCLFWESQSCNTVYGGGTGHIPGVPKVKTRVSKFIKSGIIDLLTWNSHRMGIDVTTVDVQKIVPKLFIFFDVQCF